MKKSMFIAFAYQGLVSDCLYLVTVLILSDIGKKNTHLSLKVRISILEIKLRPKKMPEPLHKAL